ncbi:MAG: hypothetical protein HC914_21125, partial [Chloroflexaceae bacterium]|nr:hypothetical protein [Chloroflexaceae bacterium]
MSLALVRLVQAAGNHRRLALVRPLLAGAGTLVVLLTLPYLSMLFLRLTPEYHRAFPEARPAIYRADYGDVRPQGGYFGFPQRDGWKVIGELYRQGVLQGSYDSNEKQPRVTWYTHGAFFCDLYPDYIFRATLEDTFSPRGYNLMGYVLVDGEKKMEIYTGQPVSAVPQVFELDGDTIRRSDAQTVSAFPLHTNFPVALPQYPLAATWQGGIRLVGYDRWPAQASGNDVLLALYWEAVQPLGTAYELVVELTDERLSQ